MWWLAVGASALRFALLFFLRRVVCGVSIVVSDVDVDVDVDMDGRNSATVLLVFVVFRRR